MSGSKIRRSRAEIEEILADYRTSGLLLCCMTTGVAGCKEIGKEAPHSNGSVPATPPWDGTAGIARPVPPKGEADKKAWDRLQSMGMKKGSHLR